MSLKLQDSVQKHYLAESGFDSKYGARPLRRAIQNKLEDPMANEILEGRIRTGDTVKDSASSEENLFYSGQRYGISAEGIMAI